MRLLLELLFLGRRVRSDPYEGSRALIRSAKKDILEIQIWKNDKQHIYYLGIFERTINVFATIKHIEEDDIKLVAGLNWESKQLT